MVKSKGPHNDNLTDEFPPLDSKKVAVFLFQETGAKKKQQTIKRIHKEKIVIGSVVSADVRLSTSGVSPIHAVVEILQMEGGAGEVARIFDLASSTGVFVNGKQVVTSELKQGDEIRVGHEKMQIKVESVDAVSPKEQIRKSGNQKLYISPQEDLRPLLLQDEKDVEEIFDYRPCSKEALEVVMSWRGTILDVQHFTDPYVVTVGNNKKSDFGLPPLLSSESFSMITREESGYVLNIDTQMSGVVQQKDNVKSLEQVRENAVVGPRGYQVLLAINDFSKIQIGEVDFYISFTAAPPKVKRRRIFERDPFFLKVLFTSLAFSSLLLGGISQLNPEKQIEAEELPERIVSILYKPEMYSAYLPRGSVTKKSSDFQKQKLKKKKKITKLDITPSKKKLPTKIPKEMNVSGSGKKVGGGAKSNTALSQREAKEGEGARAKGAEGRRGSPSAAPGKDPQVAAKRISPAGGRGAGRGRSRVQDEGNIDLLKGASKKILNLLGNAGQQLGGGGSKIKGFGGFTTQGDGGLALAGTGKGGGGTAASLGGLSNKGRGGGRVGTGLGAVGKGSSIVGGSSRLVKIKSGGPEEAIVMGAIDADAVEAALLAHRDEFRLCYEKEVNAGYPDLAGRIGTSFVIGVRGRVNKAGVASTSMKNVNVERCVVKVIKRIQFPIPRGGGIVQVTYPFKFSLSGR